MILNWLFKHLESRGRKFVVFSFTGEVLGYRYFPFAKENFEQIYKYPNIVIHEWVSPEGVDNQIHHSHPWSYLSLIVKGGYTETRKNNVYTRRAPCLIYLKNTKEHSLSKFIPGSVSIFFHFFKTKNWTSEEKNIESLTDTYLMKSGVSSPSSWRGIVVAPYTPQLMEKLARRRRAYQKIKQKTSVLYKL